MPMASGVSLCDTLTDKWRQRHGEKALLFFVLGYSAGQTSRGRRRAYLPGTTGLTAPSPAPAEVSATLCAFSVGGLTTKVGKEDLPTWGLSQRCVCTQ